MEFPYYSFTSFDHLKKVIEEFEKECFVNFTIGRCKKLKENSQYAPTMVYSYILYRCKFGGYSISRSKGQRHTSSFKINCPSYISFGLKQQGDGSMKLQTLKRCLSHNHALDKLPFEHMPKQRNMQEGQKFYVMNTLRVNKNWTKMQARLLSNEILLKKNQPKPYYIRSKVFNKPNLVQLIKSMKKRSGSDEEDKLCDTMSLRYPRNAQKRDFDTIQDATTLVELSKGHIKDAKVLSLKIAAAMAKLPVSVYNSNMAYLRNFLENIEKGLIVSVNICDPNILSDYVKSDPLCTISN